MTISASTTRWEYNGDASTTVFAYDNKIFASSDLLVYVDGTLQTETTHYSVDGVGAETGGNVTFVTAPGSGTANVVIIRDVPDTQATAYPAAGPFPAKSVEDALDKLTVMVQQALIEPFAAYTVATLPSVVPQGRTILVTDETGGSVLAFSDGTDWRRVTDRAVVS